MKFEIGQRVRIKPNAYEIPEPEDRETAFFDPEMEEYCGCVGMVEDITEAGFYVIEEIYDWVWNEVWLEPVISEEEIFIGKNA